MIFLLTGGMQNAAPQSPLQVRFAGTACLPAEGSSGFPEKGRGIKTEVRVFEIQPPAFAAVGHGDYLSMGELQHKKTSLFSMLPAPTRSPDTVGRIMLDAQDLSALSMESHPFHSRNPQHLIAVYLQQGRRVCCRFISFQTFKTPIQSARQQGNGVRCLQGEKETMHVAS